MSANRFGCFVFVAMLASPAFAQLPIVTSSTLKLHLDAASGVTTSGGLVTQWNDLSGNNNHFGQATVADRPALIGSGLNSLPTIRFTNDDLNVIGAGLNSNPAQPFTFFAVTSGTTNPRGLFDSAPSQANVFRHFADNRVELWNSAPAITFDLAASGSVIATSGYLNNAKRNLTNREFFGATGLDHRAAFSTNVNNVVFLNPNIGSINNDFGTGAFNGDLSELLVFQGPMSVPDQFAVEVYLRNKYNINPVLPGSEQRLPNPIISNSATPFSPAFAAENALDGVTTTDYASQGQGANTFMDFDFGAPTLLTRVDYTDRATGAPVGTDNVTEFNLIFSSDAIFGNGDDQIVNVLSPTFGLDSISLNGGDGLMAQYMRWDVVSTLGANPGAAEFAFFTTVAAVPEPSTIMLWVVIGAVGLVAYRRRIR